MNKELIELAQKVSNEFKTSKSVHCVSHYDCDGIASAAIVYKALKRENIPVKFTFVKEIGDKEVELIKTFEEPLILFTDIGSGQISNLEEIAKTKKIIISDHHQPEKETKLIQLNPHLVGIDGGKDISGAGITYLLMKMIDSKNIDLLPFALIGATGDIQNDENGFLGLNRGFLEDAKRLGLLKTKKGLKIYGRGRKPIPQALTYTTEPYLPGITYNESGAVQFISELGIPLKVNGKWRTFQDLDLDEEKKIINGLLIRGYPAEELLGEILILDNGWEISEFSSMLNACGRLEKADVGLELCLTNNMEIANKLSKEYGRKIARYLNYVEQNIQNPEVIRQMDWVKVIIAKNKVHANMIGTITSILHRSNTLKCSVLIGTAYAENDSIKISGRSSQEALNKNFCINSILSEICSDCGGKAGGHKLAAGGRIPQENEEKFINLLNEVVKRFNLEEKNGKKN